MNAQDIIDATAAHFGMRPCDLIGPGRNRTRIKARFIASLIARERLDMSYPEIAHMLGYADHTSVMSGVRRARQELCDNDFWQSAYNDIERSLRSWHAEEAVEELEMSA